MHDMSEKAHQGKLNSFSSSSRHRHQNGTLLKICDLCEQRSFGRSLHLVVDGRSRKLLVCCQKSNRASVNKLKIVWLIMYGSGPGHASAMPAPALFVEVTGPHQHAIVPITLALMAGAIRVAHPQNFIPMQAGFTTVRVHNIEAQSHHLDPPYRVTTSTCSFITFSSFAAFY